MERYFAASLSTLPRLRFEDVERIVGRHSTTKEARLSKGYKFFVEAFIHNYQVSNVVDRKVVVRARCYRSMRKNEEPHTLEMALESEEVVGVSTYMCSCAAGKGLCNHLTTLLYQTAHYVQLNLQTVPPPLACTGSTSRGSEGTSCPETKISWEDWNQVYPIQGLHR
ncbi:Trypsin [Labeo rohita]|uniref:Trypsin n=1 Tax=Labeo rohita TaxID=84645 RepID=A0ABQ8L0W1_LABRO|nr:Trypsin [Labeo rohita]